MAKPPQSRLDLRAILDASLRFYIAWLLMVLVVILAGYPGVVCVTPMAWLMGLAVGLRCVQRSSSPERRQRVVEAAIAGALLGLLQGVLFLIVIPQAGAVQVDERAGMIAIEASLFCVGVPVAASLAAFTAWLFERRRAE